MTYDDFIKMVCKCAKCGAQPREGKKSLPGYWKTSGAKVPPYVWNRKEKFHDEIVGYCMNCRPQGATVLGTPPAPIKPTSLSPDAEKYDWFGKTLGELSLAILEVFGEPLSITEVVARRNEWKRLAHEAHTQKTVTEI